MATGQLLTRYDVTDLNNGAVDEFPVADPPGWDEISLYYARALLDMGWQQSPDGDTDVESMWGYSDDPTSYFFQAAMHWFPRYDGIPPAPYDERWSHCTHGPAASEQFFLPWHRAYIYFFEVIIRAKVAALGGPEDWALPYWNYSDTTNADPATPWPRSNLPWVFCQAELPGGDTNPLYIADISKRGLQPTWPGTQETMYLNPGTPFYAGAYSRPDYLGFNATLDGRPHGQVHVDTGTGDEQVVDGGWMTSTVTASFDPIFWLHHSEIDRFWSGWNAGGMTIRRTTAGGRPRTTRCASRAGTSGPTATWPTTSSSTQARWSTRRTSAPRSPTRIATRTSRRAAAGGRPADGARGHACVGGPATRPARRPNS